jgi:hypothetical protein
MKLLATQADHLVFGLGKRERSLFREVLKHFPLVPVSHHRIGRAPATEPDGATKLLEEAMSARQREHQGRLSALLGDQRHLVAAGAGYNLRLSREEVEWLLQVLNDVRVGSWLILGCPDPDQGKALEVNESSSKYLFLMELAGYFESELLEAVDGST